MKLAFKTMPQNIEWSVMLETWRELDADPRYESAWVFDHFYPIYGGEEGPCLEAWVTLSALAQATERIRIGSMVNAAPYRHPGLCAAMASSLDIVSGGRLDLGLGAGWNEVEAGAYGISLAERFDRFEEYLECVVSLLGQPITNFDGRYYTLTNARNEPKGPQQPTPPIVIGGAGPRRTMPLVAKWADHWNFPGGEVAKFAEVKARLVECCEEIGRDPAEITTSTHLIYRAEDPIDNVITQAEQFKAAGLDLAILYPFSPVEPASVHDMADALEKLVEAG
ncbi:TIGR03560 family F420-dependent LLM class oxidoreductase [Candidatus Poriferisocius sp.]|uniref:TIGR03560 family F420-dependent LLM class oxidoreductase n=1 Tax=Candidatus Poriferisocius sp. TaxID=3101276 RepID=UPI003B01641B